MDVIILAGGLGTRLSGVVKDVPKCMADIAGKPFLEYLLNYLTKYKVDNVILALGHLKEVVIDWCEKNKKNYKFSISYSIETEPLGTGGAIKNAFSKGSTSSNVVVINGDTFYEVDLDKLYQQHLSLPSSITIALKPMVDFDRYGNVTIDEKTNQIVRFEEKKYCDKGLINGGIYVINKSDDIFAKLPSKFSFETDVLQPLCTTGKVYSMRDEGNFIDIGIPVDYELAQTKLPEWIAQKSERK